MSRLGLTLLVFAAGLGVLAVAVTHGVSAPAALGAAAATWLALLAGVRLLNALLTARALRREGPSGLTATTLAAARRVLDAAKEPVAVGRPPERPLDRAVLVLAPELPAPDEDDVVAAVLRSRAPERRRLVYDLRRVQQDAVDALGSAFGPLRDSGRTLLRLLGHPTPPVLGHLFAAPEWAAREGSTDVEQAEATIAMRVLRHGLAEAALAALARARRTPRVRRLARFARAMLLLERARRGELVTLTGRERVKIVEDLVVLAGARTPELLPGSPLLAALPDGARSLRAIVRRRPGRLRDIAEVAREDRALIPRVASVLAFAMGWRTGSAVTALRAGTPDLPADPVLGAVVDGLLALDEDRPAAAAEAFEDALARSRHLVAAAYGLAVARREQGREAEGEAVLRQTLERRTGDAETWLLLARYLATGASPRSARPVYEQAARRFPRSVRLRVAFARDLMEWGDTDAAFRCLQDARKHAPDDPHLAFFAGRVAAEEGRLDDALDALESAEDGLSGLHLGEALHVRMTALRELGDHGAALRIAIRVVPLLGRGQAHLLEDVAEYLEERREYVRAREAALRARHLRDEWSGGRGSDDDRA